MKVVFKQHTSDTNSFSNTGFYVDFSSCHDSSSRRDALNEEHATDRRKKNV